MFVCSVIGVLPVVGVALQVLPAADDQVALGRLATRPPHGVGEIFAAAPVARLPIVGQIMEPGRQFHPPTTSVTVQAIHDGESIALLVRSVVDGLTSVPEEVARSATAMGYTSVRRFFGVDLPLAVPVIAAGLRVAAVSSVSMVSIASLIGVNQLGDLLIA